MRQVVQNLKTDPHPRGIAPTSREFHPDGINRKIDSIGQAGQGLPRLNKSKNRFNEASPIVVFDCIRYFIWIEI